MNDISEIIKNIIKGEFTRKEFRDELIKDGIKLLKEEEWGLVSKPTDKEDQYEIC